VRTRQACVEKLPREDVAHLITMVGDKALNPECQIDTSGIKTLKDAKAADPPCEVDQFPAICPQVRRVSAHDFSRADNVEN
jgi:hypothetical protein